MRRGTGGAEADHQHSLTLPLPEVLQEFISSVAPHCLNLLLNEVFFRASMPPLVPCPEARRAALWRQFLHSPGVWQMLLEDLRQVKALDSKVETAPGGEDEFLPLSESSRYSLLERGSPRSPLPPMSPRTPRTPRTPEPESDTSSVFFLERNIDQVLALLPSLLPRCRRGTCAVLAGRSRVCGCPLSR